MSRTGRPMQTLVAFIELRLSWAKVDLQLLGVLSSAVGMKNMSRKPFRFYVLHPQIFILIDKLVKKYSDV